jgi:hypothetical protein
MNLQEQIFEAVMASSAVTGLPFFRSFKLNSFIDSQSLYLGGSDVVMQTRVQQRSSTRFECRQSKCEGCVVMRESRSIGESRTETLSQGRLLLSQGNAGTTPGLRGKRGRFNS